MSTVALPALLATRLCAWVDQELEGFTPWHAPGATKPTSLQRFAELAIAYDVLDRSPLHLPSIHSRWGPFIREHLNDRAFAELARSRLEWSWALLLPYLVLRARGEINEYHDDTLRASRRAGFPRALEVVPYRALDYAYFAERAGLAESGSDSADTLLDRTFAARASCSYLVTNEAAYALTHSIFYASAFGREQVADNRLPGAAAIVDSMIIDCCIRRRYDLLGELLIASQVLGGTDAEIGELGMQVFVSTLDSGSLLPNAEVTDRTFDTCYHPTMVGLILCASLATSKS